MYVQSRYKMDWNTHKLVQIIERGHNENQTYKHWQVYKMWSDSNGMNQVHKVGDKWAIGEGEAVYKTKEEADRAYLRWLRRVTWKEH